MENNLTCRRHRTHPKMIDDVNEEENTRISRVKIAVERFWNANDIRSEFAIRFTRMCNIGPSIDLISQNVT